MRSLALSAALVLFSPALASAQDAGAGEKVFAQCRACHQLGESAKNAVGPVLNGLFGRKAGTVEGYNYSPANKNSGITWDEAVFREYIKDPKAKDPRDQDGLCRAQGRKAHRRPDRVPEAV
jgi:cytochrome c